MKHQTVRCGDSHHGSIQILVIALELCSFCTPWLIIWNMFWSTIAYDILLWFCTRWTGLTFSFTLVKRVPSYHCKWYFIVLQQVNCVGKLTIIASDNGLSPGRRQAIIRTNAGILLIWPLVTKFSEILIEIHTFLFKCTWKCRLCVKWRPFFLGPNVLTISFTLIYKVKNYEEGRR